MTISHAAGQEGKVKRADKDYENYALMDAIGSYENLIKKGYSDEEIFKRLGDSHYMNAQYASAAAWYGKLVRLENTNIDPDYYFRYAQSLKSLGDYESSDTWMEKFISKKGSDQRARNFVRQQNYLERIKKNSGRYILGKMSINSTASDFAPSFFRDGIVFSTARDSGITSRNIHEWDNGSFLSLYSSKVLKKGSYGEPKKFSKTLNTKAHESSSIFTKDGNTVYFTRNNSSNGKFARDSKGISRLKVFKSTFLDGKWNEAIELPFNNDDYSIAHPALSHDEKALYFSSDMPGSLGASDIFKVRINGDGSYGTPENLGTIVNTEAREGFPFIMNDVLYFSSDGHPGLGGLDVFAVKLDDPSSEVINLGEPLNSRQDDFSYIIDSSGDGFFASNRDGGMGSDDIYSIIQTAPLQFTCISTISGTVKDLESANPIPAANVTLMIGADVLAEIKVDSNGKFNLDFDCNKENYSIVANMEGYIPSSEKITVVRGKPVIVDLGLQSDEAHKAGAGTDLVDHLELSPIYFDLNKSNIRPDAQRSLDVLVSYLNEYPDLKLAIESHTDAKGSNSYNQRLSERRAEATLEYLISKGVNAKRMSSTGFGENKLVNGCKEWSMCSPVENERNRRSEIIVVQ